MRCVEGRAKDQGTFPFWVILCLKFWVADCMTLGLCFAFGIWVLQEQSRGCFGCFTKPSLIFAVDEPSKGLTIQGGKVKRSSFSEDFWSSSECEMEHSVVPSQRSISSISISNQSLDPSGSTNHPSEFVNHGLLLWNLTRQQWLGNKRSKNQAQLQESTISWNAIYESLCGNNKPFPRPISLPEMVDFLVDVWEQEGLYD